MVGEIYLLVHLKSDWVENCLTAHLVPWIADIVEVCSTGLKYHLQYLKDLFYKYFLFYHMIKLISFCK